MRFVSFSLRGAPRYGVVEREGVVDLTQRMGGEFASLRELLAGNGRVRVEQFLGRGRADHGLDQLSYLPVIPEPAKIICVGVNYHDHRTEMGRDTGKKPEYPMIFTRWPSSLVGHDQPLVKPRESEAFDYEGEIAVIIGKAGRRIPRERAFDYVAGYSVFQDGSVRDFQRHTSQFTAGKNFFATGALGPELVTRDEVADPFALTLVTRLNGVEMQRAVARDMIFGIEETIAYCSLFTELLPGDVIATGTPGGVGVARNPPVFMKPGDTVEVEVSGIGTLRNPVSEG
jgi:2-keto-4-pentenoate hydratase/2-oxohepta-3-ene-1,7-dioic acid hydratase in catechol pathway